MDDREYADRLEWEANYLQNVCGMSPLEAIKKAKEKITCELLKSS